MPEENIISRPAVPVPIVDGENVVKTINAGETFTAYMGGYFLPSWYYYLLYKYIEEAEAEFDKIEN